MKELLFTKMCGVTAIIGGLPDREATIERMTRAIEHRGPDGQGLWLGNGCALGHRRLKILDLSERAAQPMTSDDGSIALSYNGEVYNFRELRAELEKKGHRFRSTGDTEVVLRLYQEEEDRFVERLDGMFAFILWDGRRSTALVARDRFGQKPLFFATHGEALLVSSEIKSLLAVPGVSRAPSAAAIDAYLTANFVPAPLSFFEGIQRLEPGHLLSKTSGARHTLTRYTPPRPAPSTLRYRDAVDRVDELFDRAVERQLVADVPVGLFLSGGIDSSLVLSRVAPRLGRGFSAFSVAFDEAARSELPFAKRAASRFGATLHTVTARPSDFADPGKLVDMFDEPFADVATLAVAKLCKVARETVTVALTGDGGDELFGGYELHVIARYAELLGDAGPVRRSLSRLSSFLPDSAGFRSPLRAVKRGLSMAGDDWRATTQRLRANLSPSERRDLYASDFRRTLEHRDPYGELLPRGGELADLFDPLSDRVLGDLFLYKTDITAMASGLECRSPFLDVELSQFARSLPLSFLVRWISGKRILRDLVGREVDAGLGRRRKMGFTPPLDEWLRADLSFLLDEHLGHASSPLYDYVSWAEVQRRIVEHRERRANHRRVLWSLVLLQVWLDRARRDLSRAAA